MCYTPTRVIRIDNNNPKPVRSNTSPTLLLTSEKPIFEILFRSHTPIT